MPDLAPYDLEDAQELVNDAVRRSTKRHDRWRALEHLYRTGLAVDTLAEADVPGHLWDDLPGLTLGAINLVLPHINIILASVVARDPAHVVEPYAGGDQAEGNARTGERALRYFWKRNKATDVLRDMTQDMVVLGSGFSKVGWAHEEAPTDREPDEMVQELAALVERERLNAKLDPEATPRTIDELVDMVPATATLVAQDEPYLEYVSPYDLFVPSNARRLADCRWVAQRVIMPADEVLANDAWNVEAGQLTPISREARPDDREADENRRYGATDGDDTDPFAEVELFEFYDMRTRTLLIFQLGSDEPIYEGPIPYTHRHSPFVQMRNFEDGGRRFWPFSDLEAVSAVQAEFNEYVTEQMENARRSGTKWAIDADAYDDDVAELLDSPESDVAIPIRLNGRNINDVVSALERKGLSSDVYQAKADLSGHMREILGINDFQAGGMGADRMSATAAAVVDGTATLRAADKVAQVERAASDMGLLMLLLCQEFMDLERAIRVTGDENAGAQWLDISKDDLIGEYGVSVEGGSTQAVNPATRQQKAMDLLSGVIPALEAAGYDTSPLYRIAMRDLGYDPDIVLVKPEPAPAAPPGPGGPPGMAMPPGLPPMPPTDQQLAGGPPVPAEFDGGLAL